ncbi:uncharacterized protein L3040_006841 [Drepanopeziza brunnea f. sp. 'multigermtubi']|uniref:uncharacterized protein n=1 Tax=Drepanopeziza brunnea f. sp. 'multigermtubi' TaxID=698441 RepID=UPI0023958580|nr:hypothetical protein L3040_006841 [Drepanopeziza brunnea f. sp. 'multigermtubi']
MKPLHSITIMVLATPFLLNEVASATFSGSQESFEIPTTEIIASAADADLPYPLVENHPKGNINGIHVEGTGTMNEIIAQQAARGATIPLLSVSPVAKCNESLEAYAIGHFCIPVAGHNWGRAPYMPLYEMVTFFQEYQYTWSMEPRRCAMALCIDDAAAYVCNDWFSVHQTSLAEFAEHLMEIVHFCCVSQGPQVEWSCGGQSFDDLGWNVILKWNPGCKKGGNLGQT